MTQAQVLAAESNSPVEVSERTGEVIVQFGSTKPAELDGRLVYIFANDKLVRTKYMFEAEHGDLNDFIRDFKIVEPALREQYGKPSEEQAIWEDDSTQLESKPYLDQDRATPANILPSDGLVGLAVSLGHLKLYTRWDGARTKVLHALTGGNHQIAHQIEYRSVELRALEDEVRQSGTKAVR